MQRLEEGLERSARSGTLAAGARAGPCSLAAAVLLAGALLAAPAPAQTNTPPTGADKTVTTNEDANYTFAVGDFGFADDDGDTLASVKVVTVPAAGSLFLESMGTSTLVSVNDTVTKAQLDSGVLVYRPVSNANGDPYTSFTFTVNDGTADSALSYTMTIDVTAVQDAPTGSPTISGNPHVGQTLTASVSGIGDPDGLASPGYTYQWIRVEPAESNISGATGSTYTLTRADYGHRIKVRVAFTDDDGTAESLTSAVYAGTLAYIIDVPGALSLASIVAGDAAVAAGMDTPHDTGGISRSDVEFQYRTAAGAAVPEDTVWSDLGSRPPDGIFFRGLQNGTLFAIDLRASNPAGPGPAVTVTATPQRAACAAPALGDRRQIWSAGLTVGAAPPAALGGIIRHRPWPAEYYGYDASAPDGSTVGALSDTGFQVGATTYSISELDVHGVTYEDLLFVLRNRALSPAHRAALRLHVCDDAAYDFITGNVFHEEEDGEFVYVRLLLEPSSRLRWSLLADRTVYLSLPANRPATGEPAVTGQLLAGQVLTASRGTIADEDGLTLAESGETGFGYAWQWLRADGGGDAVEISGATAATYTVTREDVGKTLKVRVSFTDDLDSAESRESDVTDTRPPVLTRATVNADALVLTYDETLDGGSVPAPGDFRVRTDGSAVGVGRVSVSGSRVTLTLATAVAAGQTVTLDYTPGTNPTQDVAGNDAAPLSGYPVINNTGNPEPPEPGTNRPPSVSATCDPCEVRPGGEVRLEASATDPDGDALTYAWSAPQGRFSGATDGAAARWTAPGAAGRVTVRVTVSDGRGGSASATVTVVVTNRPEPATNGGPAFESSGYAFELRENADGSRRPIDLGTASASDPDGDELTYELASGDRSRFTFGERDAVVRYTGPGEDFELTPNRYELTLRARDPHGAAAEARAVVRVVNVNEAPVAEDDEADANEDMAVRVDVLANDADPDGDSLRVESVSDPAHGTAAPADGGVLYTPEADYHGADRFTYVVSDGNGATAEAAVEVTVLPVNDAPVAVGMIPDQSLEESGGEAAVELGPYFADPDGDAPAYRASVSDPSVAAVTVAGAVLTLAPVEYGSATVTVTAEDGGGLTATQAFAVGVSDRLARRAVSDTLAGLARSHLASARMMLGRRVTAGRTEASRLTLLGRSAPLGEGAAQVVAEQMLGRSVPLSKAAARTAVGRMLASWLSSWAGPHGGPGGAPGLGAGLAGMSGMPAAGGAAKGMMPAAATGRGARFGAGRSGFSGVSRGLGGFGSFGRFGSFAGGADPLRGSEFLLALGGGRDAGEESEPGRRWQVWGQGDVQTFQGAPSAAIGYDGELQTGYVGVDTWVTERWLAGAAVARSRGYGDWRAGGSQGSLSTTLTAVHPYVRWSDGATSVWATAGGGRGGAENVRRSGRVGSSGLGLRVGLVELRRRLGESAGGYELGVRADGAWAGLRTAGGEETIDGRSAGVHQVRVGAEVSRPVRLGVFSLAPFGEAHVRRDGGAGQAGAGIEVAGGLRASAGKVRVDAQGRMLAVHSADGYRERGLGVTLGVGNQDREGLSLSVSPRWGGSAAGGGTLWQEQLYRRHLPEAGPEAWVVDARGEYGVRLRSGRLLTWFGSLSRSRFGRRFLVGGRVGVPVGVPGS